jgi:peptidoglycan/LPS O-acetylase OafA/YrhL
MQKQRYDTIDFLRGISILLVVISHVRIRIPFKELALLDWIPENVLNAVFYSGNEGVRIFFVISGFLITATSLKRWGKIENIDIRTFYRLRFARIAPCLLGLLFILSVLHFVGVKDYVISSKFTYLETLFAALTFHVNWLEGVKGYLPGNWDVLWSLSVEEVFYIFFPVVCIFSRSKYIFSILLMALVLYAPFYRISLHGDWIWYSKAYFSCMDSIAIGCLVSFWTFKKEFSKVELWLFNSVGLALILFAFLFNSKTFFPAINELSLYQTILSIGVALILISSVRQKLFMRKVLYPITLYGRLSYEVYLIHMFVVYSGIRVYKYYGSPFDYSLIWLLGIVFIAGVLGGIVERYFSAPLNIKLRKMGSCNESK